MSLCLCIACHALLRPRPDAWLWLSGGQAQCQPAGPFQSQERKKTRYLWSYFGCLSCKQSSQSHAQLLVPPGRSLQYHHVRITKVFPVSTSSAVFFFLLQHCFPCSKILSGLFQALCGPKEPQTNPAYDFWWESAKLRMPICWFLSWALKILGNAAKKHSSPAIT